MAVAAALRSHGALQRLGLQGNELREPDDRVFLLRFLEGFRVCKSQGGLMGFGSAAAGKLYSYIVEFSFSPLHCFGDR